MSEENKEVVEGEVVSEEKKEEKKGGFKAFWEKTKKNVSDSMLEAKIRTHYEENSTKASLYSLKENFLLGNCSDKYGNFENDTFSYWESNKDEEPVVGSILKIKDAYYQVKSFEKDTIKTAYDGIEYTRDGFKLFLNNSPKEVKVVKADKKYFLLED